MARGRNKVDPYAKKASETDLQWRSRIARLKQMDEAEKETLVSPETQRHGDYYKTFVMHVETGTYASTERNRQVSSLAVMRDKGRISDQQFDAAQRIAGVAEAIERNASVRCASLEARVDCSGSSRNPLIETLHQVRMERAYTAWRERLPYPKRMIIDMVICDRSLKATARKYGVGWPRAFRLLGNALDEWPAIWDFASRVIDQDDVDAAHRRVA